MKTFDALVLGYTGATIGAACMLILGILGNLGLYAGAVAQMAEWHVFFSLSVGGIIGGMIEAAVWSFVILWVFGWLYNMFIAKKRE